MICDVDELHNLKNHFKYTDTIEQQIGELFYNEGMLPKPHRYSTGREPGWDIMYKDGTKFEIKIQSSVDLVFKIKKIRTNMECGVHTTDSNYYCMVNRVIIDSNTNIGAIRIIQVSDIIHYLNNTEHRLVKSDRDYITFVDPTKIDHIVLGYIECNNYGKQYNFEKFLKLYGEHQFLH